MSSKYNFIKIKKDFNEVIFNFFKNDVNYVFFSGSVAYGGGRFSKSDIDVVVVLKHGHIKNFLEKHIEFSKRYIDLNLKYNFIPDLDFPGEFLTQDLVKDAILGRGFSIKNRNIFLPPASVEYYLKNQEHWFRAWLSMITFSVYSCGSKSSFKKNKMSAWSTSLLFILLNQKNKRTINLKQILKIIYGGSDKWLGLGITKNYVLFEKLEVKFIKRSLKVLIKKGYLGSFKNDRYEIFHENIKMWADSIVSYIENKKIKKSKFLVSTKDSRIISKKSLSYFKYIKKQNE